MSSVKAMFSDVFNYDEFGVVTGTVGATRFPNVGCGMVRFKAHPANLGTFSIGHNSGTSAAYLDWPFAAGDDSGWIPTNNLNRYWYKSGSGTATKLSYWALK